MKKVLSIALVLSVIVSPSFSFAKAGRDVCKNLSGVQTTVPAGYTIINKNECVPIEQAPDVCPNIDGIQLVVPENYYINEIGECVSY